VKEEQERREDSGIPSDKAYHGKQGRKPLLPLHVCFHCMPIQRLQFLYMLFQCTLIDHFGQHFPPGRYARDRRASTL
jgi:hypothetical protein